MKSVSLLLAAVAYLIYLKYKLRKAPPGSLGWFFLTELYQYTRNPLRFCQRRCLQYGKNFTTYTEGPLIKICNVRDRETFLYSDKQGLTEIAHYQFTQSSFSQAVFLKPGNEHQRFRKEFLNYFSTSPSKYANQTIQIIKRRLKEFENRWVSSAELSKISFEIALTNMWGVECTAMEDDLYHHLLELVSLVTHPLLMRFVYNNRLRIVKQKIGEWFHQRVGKQHPFIGKLDKSFEGEAIVDTLVIVLFASFETTYSSMCNLVYCYSMYGQSTGLDTIEQCRAFVQETARLYTTITTFKKRATCDIPLSDGYVVPKGCKIQVQQHVLHRDPDIWPDAETFLPGRFLEPLTKDQQIAYTPFGHGEYSCLGRRNAEVMLELFVQFLSTYQVSVRDVKHVQYPIQRMNSEFYIQPQ